FSLFCDCAVRQHAISMADAKSLFIVYIDIFECFAKLKKNEYRLLINKRISRAISWSAYSL
ncbi:hypothetical protein, partial [Bacteroides sp.]|uniref:hypothetical protein n=1 Tax=Bacteroides sp. TaxID=29523 RepID=UPI002FC7AD36